MNRAVQRVRNGDGSLPPWYLPLDNPRWIGAAAAGRMRPEDPVLGLELAGGAWALPWWIMKNHHVANLELAGQPVLVVLCMMCSSGAAFDPVIDGRRHTFRAEGSYNGAVMPLDYETESLWTSSSGEAIEGPLAGRVMPRLPLLQSTWQEWRELHPHTLVPEGEGESRGGHGEWQTPGSPMLGNTVRARLLHVDRRLPHHELVLGVSIAGEHRCYPLAELSQRGRALHDTLGGEEIVILSSPGSWMASAWRRRLDDGRALDFRTQGNAIVDQQTGSRWEVDGVARAGPLHGRRLGTTHCGVQEFYSWAALHPGTAIFGAAAAPADAPWSGERLPEPIIRAAKSGWWPLDAKLLQVGCGSGMQAAWLAEVGYDVVAIDADAGQVARARQSFRGMRRLRFEVADIRRPLALGERFAAAFDDGGFAALRAEERSAYAAHLAAVCAPGARVLLLLGMPAAAEDFRRRFEALRRIFAPAFRVLDAQARKGGGAVRLVRQETK